MLNRRKAMIGWLVYLGAKKVLRQKAKDAVPRSGGGGRGRKVAIGAGLAAVLAGLMFWRRGSDDGDSGFSTES